MNTRRLNTSHLSTSTNQSAINRDDNESTGYWSVYTGSTLQLIVRMVQIIGASGVLGSAVYNAFKSDSAYHGGWTRHFVLDWSEHDIYITWCTMQLKALHIRGQQKSSRLSI